MNFILQRTFLILLLLLIPIPLLFFIYQERLSELSDLEYRILELKEKAGKSAAFTSMLAREREEMHAADPFFLDKHLSSLHAPSLMALSDPSQETPLPLQKKVLKRSGSLQELEISLAQPVLSDATGLKQLLIALEGVTIDGKRPPTGRPPIQIQRFELVKRPHGEAEAYALDFTAVVRTEFR